MLEKKESQTRILRKICAVILIVAICALVIFLIIKWLNSENITRFGDSPEATKSFALVCVNDDAEYPYYNYEGATRHETKITAMFTDDKLKSISLANTLFFDNVDDVVRSEALNHAAMNLSFAENHLGLALFSAAYARLEDRMVGSIYTASDDFRDGVAPYYLLEKLDKNTPHGQYADIYTAQGFTCQYQ